MFSVFIYFLRWGNHIWDCKTLGLIFIKYLWQGSNCQKVAKKFNPERQVNVRGIKRLLNDTATKAKELSSSSVTNQWKHNYSLTSELYNQRSCIKFRLDSSINRVSRQYIIYVLLIRTARKSRAYPYNQFNKRQWAHRKTPIKD